TSSYDISVLYRLTSFSLYSKLHPQDLHSFPTRRSSDLKPCHEVEDKAEGVFEDKPRALLGRNDIVKPQRSGEDDCADDGETEGEDRKSTRLNSRRPHLVCRLLLEKKKLKLNAILNSIS